MDIIIAVSTTDPLSGGAGWFGAGLLGMVLGWLLIFYLPSKDKQQKDSVDSTNSRFDKLIVDHLRIESEQRADFKQALADQRVEFKQALTEVVSHCEEEMRNIREHFDKHK